MDTNRATNAFSAMAQATRLGLLRLLATKGAGGMPAGEIATELGVVPATLSFHLATLEEAGLVRSARRGRQVRYAVRNTGLRDVFSYFIETCCAGRPELSGDLIRRLPAADEEETGMTPSFNVLFLCTHNAARSIMAEAILAQIGRDRFRAYSAGSDPSERPLAQVVELLRSLGHDTTALRSKSWNEFMKPDAPRMDFIIALCDTAQGQECPELGPRALTGAWPMPDPAKFHGTGPEQTVMLNELYAGIRRRLDIFCNLPFASLGRAAIKARLDEIGVPNRPAGPAERR